MDKTGKAKVFSIIAYNDVVDDAKNTILPIQRHKASDEKSSLKNYVDIFIFTLKALWKFIFIENSVRR